jgi:hypothetical protein
MRGRTWFGGSRVAPISFEGLFGLFLGQQFQKHLSFCWVRRFGKPLPKQLAVFVMNELFHGIPRINSEIIGSDADPDKSNSDAAAQGAPS